MLIKIKTFYSRGVHLEDYSAIGQTPPSDETPPAKLTLALEDLTSCFLHMFHQKPARLFITVTFHPTTNTLKWCQTCRGVRVTTYLKQTKLKPPNHLCEVTSICTSRVLAVRSSRSYLLYIILDIQRLLYYERVHIHSAVAYQYGPPVVCRMPPK